MGSSWTCPDCALQLAQRLVWPYFGLLSSPSSTADSQNIYYATLDIALGWCVGIVDECVRDCSHLDTKTASMPMPESDPSGKTLVLYSCDSSAYDDDSDGHPNLGDDDEHEVGSSVENQPCASNGKSTRVMTTELDDAMNKVYLRHENDALNQIAVAACLELIDNDSLQLMSDLEDLLNQHTMLQFQIPQPGHAACDWFLHCRVEL